MQRKDALKTTCKKGFPGMKTLIIVIGIMFFFLTPPAHASISPASHGQNAVPCNDSLITAGSEKLTEKKPLTMVTDETGRTYFIFQHQLAGMSWAAGHHLPWVSPF